MIIKANDRNFVHANSQDRAKFRREIEQYYDPHRYLTKVRRKGKFIWGLKLFKRTRQIRYWQRRRALEKAYGKKV